MNLKILIFSCIFFEHGYISLIMALIFLKICMFIAEIFIEGSVSHNFDLGLSFYFMLCRRRHFEKKYKKAQQITKVTCFFIIK